MLNHLVLTGADGVVQRFVTVTSFLEFLGKERRIAKGSVAAVCPGRRHDVRAEEGDS